LYDFAPTAAFLTDSHGLGQTGEVLVEIGQADFIHLLLPRRQSSAPSNVARRELPALSLATQGRIGFMRTTDYRGEDVLVAYRPVGQAYPNCGLVAKIDSADAYEPIKQLNLLHMALGALRLLLVASAILLPLLILALLIWEATRLFAHLVRRRA
jgi:hypothetical protein